MPGRSTCTRCAATLPAPDLDGNQVCVSCGLFHTTDPAAASDAGVAPTAGTTAPPPPSPPPPPSVAGPFGAGGTGATVGPSVPPPPQRVAAASTPRKGRGGTIGCLVAVAVVVVLSAALVGGVAWLIGRVDDATSTATGGLGQSGSGLRPIGGSVSVVAEDGDGSPTEIVTLASRLGSGDRTMALVDLDGGVTWEADVVPGDVYSAQVATTDDLVVVGLGRKVVGLDRASGETAWTTDLPDVISPPCRDCLELVGGMVVAFTTDAQVTVIDPADGSASWSRRLTSARGRVETFDDRLLVVDEGDDGKVSVALTEVADGRPVSSFSPWCQDPVFETSTIDARPDMLLARIPGTDDLVAQFAFGRTCTVRWEATTGTERWRAPSQESTDSSEDEAGVSGTDLVTTSSQGVVQVRLAEGTTTPLPLPPETYADGQVELDGTTALVTVTSNRGTPRPIIVAYDLTTGDQIWALDLPPGAEALDPHDFGGTTMFDDTTAFLLVPSDDALRLLTVEASGRLAVSDVDPATGRTEVTGTDALRTATAGTSTVYAESVSESSVVLSVGGIVQVVDLATGTVTASWGG